MEVIRAVPAKRRFKAAIFDFDGTLSLLRRNWQGVMIPMMVDTIAATGTNETREDLHDIVNEYVTRLTGKQTIYQMIQLAEEVERRGGTAKPPLDYKQQYHDELWKQVVVRIEAVKTGKATAESMMLPGSLSFLEWLTQFNIKLYLASGTDLVYVRDEVELLGLTPFFDPHIYGALDDYKRFSKAMIIEKIIQETGVHGEQILGIGDGYVEVEEVKKVGGHTLGIASNEATGEGIDEWKRSRLLEAGTDTIVPNYLDLPAIQAHLSDALR